MNQNRKKQQLSIGALCMLSCLSLTHAARAGQWEFTKTSSGTNQNGSSGNPTWAQAPGSTGGSSPLSTNGTFTYHCKWTPSFNAETIPRTLRVGIDGQVSVSGNPAVTPNMAISIAGNSPRQNAAIHNGPSHDLSLGGSKLIAVPSGGQPSNGAVVEFDLTFPVSASCPTTGFGGSVHALVTAPVQDSRTVKISRGVTAKQKGAPGVTIDESKDEWVDVDGTGHGHTTYSYNWVGIGEQTNFQNLYANLGGTWTWKTDPQGTGDIPDVAWGWDPIGFDVADTYLSSKQRMRFGSVNKVGSEWKGAPTGTDTHTVTYTATDNGDGAKGTGKYIFTLHDAWEERTTTGPVVITKNPVLLGAPTTNTDTKANEYKLGVTETKKIAIKGGFSTEFGKTVVELLKVVPKFSLDVTYEDTTATSTLFPVTLQPGEQTWIEVAECYDRYDVKGDEYNANGWVGPNNFFVDKPRPAPAPSYTYQLHLPPIQTNSAGGTGGGAAP